MSYPPPRNSKAGAIDPVWDRVQCNRRLLGPELCSFVLLYHFLFDNFENVVELMKVCISHLLYLTHIRLAV
jgi:hypothetical protein